MKLWIWNCLILKSGVVTWGRVCFQRRSPSNLYFSLHIFFICYLSLTTNMSNDIPSLNIQGNPALLHRAQLCLLVWFRAIWNDIILGWGLISCRRSNIILVVCYYTSNWCNALIPEVWFYANGMNLNHLVAWFYSAWCFLPPSQGGS